MSGDENGSDSFRHAQPDNYKTGTTEKSGMRKGDADGTTTNNIDLEIVRRTRRAFEKKGGHHYVEKTIEGEYRLEGSPSFVAQLGSDVSSHVVSSDEPKILGGAGVHVSPLTYVLYGVVACFANTVAIQCGLKGVVLKKMRLKGRLKYDIGPMLTGIDSPLIRELRIEVEADRDIREIVELSTNRCPALFAISHGIKTDVKQKPGLQAVK
jgi:uncharacterized OsmC-like protein